MKNFFEEHYKLSEQEFEELWSTALIIFDTNALLNFYRYSNNTVAELLKIFKQFQDRLWIPYQIGKEFHEERLNVIQQQIKVYSDSLTNIKLIENDFSNRNRNPFLSEKLHEKFVSTLASVNDELESKKIEYENQLSNDKMILTLADIYDNKIGMNYSTDEFAEIYKKGEERYQSKIPPGYEDKGKPHEKKFGDLIIWFQILDKAKETNKPVIFVTDDNKEDWWLEKLGKKIGARVELKKEFILYVGQRFHIYHPFAFLEYANSKLKMSINKNVINEVKELIPISNTDLLADINNTLLISILVEKTSDSFNIERFMQLFQTSGYDAHLEDIDATKYRIFVPVPNIPDLPRRIKNKFLSQIENFGLRLIEFKPNVE